MNSLRVLALASVTCIVVAAGCQHAGAAGDHQPGRDEPRVDRDAGVGEVGSRRSQAQGPAKKPPIVKTEERFIDDDQNTLRVYADEKGKTTVRAFDKNDKEIPVKPVPIEDTASICWPTPEGSSSSTAAPARKSNCQLLNFVSDGTLMKFGSDSCVCYWCRGTPWCYGSTCP
jgi:hypothetical protein